MNVYTNYVVAHSLFSFQKVYYSLSFTDVADVRKGNIKSISCPFELQMA